jgi:hypothetical protein
VADWHEQVRWAAAEPHSAYAVVVGWHGQVRWAAAEPHSAYAVVVDWHGQVRWAAAEPHSAYAAVQKMAAVNRFGVDWYAFAAGSSKCLEERQDAKR